MATSPEDVQYVRLPERLVTGNVTDLDSEWGISGLDVKAVPDAEDEPEANAFVVSRIRSGVLEEASADEYNMICAAHSKVEAIAKASLPTEYGGPTRPSPWNEAAIASESKKQRRKLMVARLTNTFDSSPEAVDPADDDRDYLDRNHAELKSLAHDRGLDTSGTKKDITARLEQWDREQEENQTNQ